ncbi:gLUG motif-containing protein [Prevotella sp. CAG:1092]|nr:gLUG motif-containing protein [Prevotella sp. CAG:1092]
MKQTKLMKMLFVPAALSFFAACSSDNDIVGDKNSTEDKGVTLTINATAGADAAMSRVQYNNDYSVEWTSADMVYAFAGSTTNAGKCTIAPNATDKHNAKLTVTLPTTPKNGDKITAYVANYSVTAVNAKTEGLGDQVEVDYSKQDGTYADATSRCVLFGETTYNSESELSMNFEYQTTFLKLSLDFQDASVAGKAALYLTGDNVYSISRMNTTGDKAGKLGNQNGFTITVPSVDVAAGQTKDIYIAMYPGQVQNVKLQAVMTDGNTYEFNLGNANLAAGKVYKIEKNGAKVAIEAATKFAGGTGSQATPWEISNLAELKYLQQENAKSDQFSKGKYFKLTSDILINGTWTPIDNFHGNFDGNGYAILGNIKLGGTQNELGLFGVLGYNGVVKNLTNKANITTDESVTTKAVGGIVGRIKHTGNAIKNCVNKGIINSKTQYIGGILGDIYAQNDKTDAVIEACRNEGYINCTNESPRFGGIVGSINGNKANQKIIVKGCSTKDVSFTTTATTAYNGGILGYIVNPKDANQITITACWTENLSFPKVGTNRGIVASTSTIEFTLNNCWTNADNLISSTAVTPNKCYKKADKKPFSEWVTEANTAWGSTEYKFNADGTINVKK